MSRRLFPTLCLVILTALSLRAEAFVLSFSLGSIEHPSLSLQGVRVVLDAAAGTARVSADELTVGRRRWRDLRLQCPRFRFSRHRLDCRGGRLSIPGVHERLALDLQLDGAEPSVRFTLRAPEGDSVSGRLAAAEDAVFEIDDARLERLQQWLPPLASYGVGGRFSGRLLIRPRAGHGEVELSGVLSGGRFSSEDGLQAAEGVVLGVALSGSYGSGAVFDGRLRLDWRKGEAYLHPVYLAAAGALELDGRVHEDRLQVRQARLHWPGVQALQASAEIDLARGRLRQATLDVAQADLAVIGPRLLAPIIAPARADSMRFDGRLSGRLSVEHGELTALDLALHEVAIDLNHGEFGVGPVSGSLPWRRDAQRDIRLDVSGGYYEALELGDFVLDARVAGNLLTVSRVEIPVLDGRLVLTGLALERERAGWHGQGGAYIEPVSMNRLTEAVGLPSMSGVLSASLPQLRVSPGELAMDGALVMSVFDGYLHVSNLRIIEPFGVASYLYSDVVARHLDLARLTEAFAFGSVTGFIDADIHGLELAHWRPVRFDAKVRSSPGRYARRISQRAVEHIGALGGPGAALAVQRGFLRFFESFGYRELGLSCRLRDGVCTMAGIDGQVREDGSFPIVRGGGIPALNVVGYNHRVEWNELLSRLQRAIESNDAPLIQ